MRDLDDQHFDEGRPRKGHKSKRVTARDEAARAEAEWRREQLAGVEGSTEWGAGYDLGYVSGFQSGVAWADANPAERTAASRERLARNLGVAPASPIVDIIADLLPVKRTAPSVEQIAEMVRFQAKSYKAAAEGSPSDRLWVDDSDFPEEVARAIRPLLAAQPTVVQVKAEAWDEGERAGEDYGFRSHTTYGLTKPVNPYREGAAS